MPRPATRRRGVVAALLGVAMLSACTGNADEVTETPHTPAVAPTVATSTAGTVLDAALTALSDTSAAGEAARAKAFTGAALESANAWAKTLPARTAAQKAAAAISATGAKVIGVSRSGDQPQQLLVQATLTQTKAAVLVLLVADKASEFKVAAITPMLPEARVDALDPTTSGSAAVGTGPGLAAAPDTVVQAFADSVRYPEPADTNALVTDPLSERLRESALAQAEAIKAKGAFTQSHEPQGVLGGLRLKDGRGAIVFAHLIRTDTIALRQATRLTPSKDFTALTGVKLIRTEASLKSNEIIAIVIPATGAARVVAGADQLVGGTAR